MARISIPRVRDDRDSTEYRLRLDPQLNDDLLAYRQFYIRTYGQEIEPKDLLEPIIRRFFANDRGFRQFKRKGGRTPSAAPATPAS